MKPEGPIVAAVAMLLTFAPLVVDAGQIYKCVDPKTKATVYSSASCTAGTETKIETVDNAIMGGAAAQREIAQQQVARYGNQNAQQSAPSAAGPADTPERRQLASECQRGFKNSCAALRALNGEPKSKSTTCITTGTTLATPGSNVGSYNGVSSCR